MTNVEPTYGSFLPGETLLDLITRRNGLDPQARERVGLLLKQDSTTRRATLEILADLRMSGRLTYEEVRQRAAEIGIAESWAQVREQFLS